jgi:hypothetical protein
MRLEHLQMHMSASGAGIHRLTVIVVLEGSIINADKAELSVGAIVEATTAHLVIKRSWLKRALIAGQIGNDCRRLGGIKEWPCALPFVIDLTLRACDQIGLQTRRELAAISAENARNKGGWMAKKQIWVNMSGELGSKG